MGKVLVNESSLTGIADAIRGKNGTTTTYKPSEMAAAITAITGGGGGGGDLPEEAFVISGNCQYRFAFNAWNWFINNYGNRITTDEITVVSNMFVDSNELTTIPFEINMPVGATAEKPLDKIFSGCLKLTSIPKINNLVVGSMESMFDRCNSIRYLPDDIESWFNWSKLDTKTSSYSGNQSSMFKSCFSLRKIPNSFLSHGNPTVTYSYSYFNNMCQSCYSIDELIDLPIPYTATWTNQAFSNAFIRTFRLKNLTFAMPNGQPYVMNWKNQTIDLTLSGFLEAEYQSSFIINSNSGITADKQVTDNATYQALKDDPDWFTGKVEYSRYNHDSAVATINSLPDTSAYLASAGGTNTIKFKGAAGALTDGGAINTLTEEEIAVATAKGWTVTLA